MSPKKQKELMNFLIFLLDHFSGEFLESITE